MDGGPRTEAHDDFAEVEEEEDVGEEDEFFDCEDDMRSSTQEEEEESTYRHIINEQFIKVDLGFGTEVWASRWDDRVRIAMTQTTFKTSPEAWLRSQDIEAEDYSYRKLLPVSMPSKNEFSIWSILKKCIGKELSKITMPVIFNEPLSFLQRVSEYLEYAHLVHKADACADVIDRMEYVAAFAVSAVASNWERIGKPFNPLLGETYELDRSSDRGYHMVVEQVSHHPPVSAFHAEAASWRFHGAIQPKLKFWGKSVEVQPKGYVTLELLRHGETYTWQNVNCNVHNIIVGKLWVEHCGNMEIINHKTGHRVELHWKSAGWFSRGAHRIEGYILDRERRRIRALYGKWIEAMYVLDTDVWESHQQEQPTSQRKATTPVFGGSTNSSSSDDNSFLNGSPFSRLTLTTDDAAVNTRSTHSFFSSGSEESDPPPADVGDPCDLGLPTQRQLWRVHARPAESQHFYNFTHFAMTLNEFHPDMMTVLPPTDSRLRPDMRLLERGDIERAGSEKERLEEKQRSARKERKKRKGANEWSPIWFRKVDNPLTKREDWVFTNQYWEREWKERCPDIF